MFPAESERLHERVASTQCKLRDFSVITGSLPCARCHKLAYWLLSDALHKQKGPTSYQGRVERATWGDFLLEPGLSSQASLADERCE